MLLKTLHPQRKRKENVAKFNIPPSTLSTVIKKKGSLKASYTLENKDNHDPMRPHVDEALHL